MTLTSDHINDIPYVVDRNAPLTRTNDDGTTEDSLGYMFLGVLFIHPQRLDELRAGLAKVKP